jgi:hypothetical protein
VTVHSIVRLAFVSGRLRPTLARSQRSRGQPLDAGEKALVAERPADAFGAAQTIELGRFRLVIEQIGEAGKALADRRQRGDPVILPGQMRACTRPAPVPRPIHQPRPHRVKRHVAQRGGKMRFVHDHGAEAPLPEVAGTLAARVDDARIAAMDRGERPPQAIGIGWHQNEMDVVGH